jgi:hypothetical protein
MSDGETLDFHELKHQLWRCSCNHPPVINGSSFQFSINNHSSFSHYTCKRSSSSTRTYAGAQVCSSVCHRICCTLHKCYRGVRFWASYLRFKTWRLARENPVCTATTILLLSEDLRRSCKSSASLIRRFRSCRAKLVIRHNSREAVNAGLAFDFKYWVLSK